jgi:CRISPR-associated protein Csb2
MPLVLEIEHLLGVAFAAQSPANDAPDWPPQPDRVFSALVASWAARGKSLEERRALEWLETQPEPKVVASEGWPRTVPTVFVPPNDPQTGRVGNVTLMPAMRRRQPRRFPAYRPVSRTVWFVWPDGAEDQPPLAPLNAIAAYTAYIGHSASLTRCRFATKELPQAGTPLRSRIYPGRLAELERLHSAGQRPNYREHAGQQANAATAMPSSQFSPAWLVLEHVDGEMPDLLASALVAKALHKTVMSGYRGGAVPADISGHTPNGAPTTEPHLAIAPLAFLGSRYASGAVYGFALVPPRDSNLLVRGDFQQALREVMPWSDEHARRELHGYGSGLDVTFAIADAEPRRSLDPAPYTDPGRIWATCTPIVLDRHLKETGNRERVAEIEALVAHACVNIGLPRPWRVVACKHSDLEGVPSAYPSGRAPAWTNWRLPPSLASRQLTHAIVQFREPVHGPVMLGAGRFVGLGLCRALDATRSPS